MNCENCKNEHNGYYGSGRFCSSKCARGFSTKSKRAEINKKISSKLKGREGHDKGFKKGHDDRRKILTKEDRLKAVKAKELYRKELYSKLEFINLPMAEKRRIVLREQENKCFECKIDSWLGNPITLELHHIDGDNTNNERTNLMFLCPNCHSQTDSWRRKK